MKPANERLMGTVTGHLHFYPFPYPSFYNVVPRHDRPQHSKKDCYLQLWSIVSLALVIWHVGRMLKERLYFCVSAIYKGVSCRTYPC